MVFWLLVIGCLGWGPPALGAEELLAAGSVTRQVDYIMAIDSTGSMAGRGGVDSSGRACTRWEELREKLVQIITELEPGENVRLHLLFFGASVYQRQGALRWEGLSPSTQRLPGDRTSAVTVPLRGEAEKRQVLSLLNQHRPNAGHTALWDAIGACFDRALELFRLSPERRVLIAVFSDGEDNGSSEYTTRPPRSGTARPRDLCAHIDRVKSTLGPVLLNAQWHFVRVAGVRIDPPCGVFPSDRTPSVVQVMLGPEQIRAGSLAEPLSVPAELQFMIQGTLPAGLAFPLVFEPDPGAPPVRVTTEDGAPATVSSAGRYRVLLHRVGQPEDYVSPFTGRIRLDLGRYRDGAVDRVMVWDLNPAVRIDFAGAAKIPLAEGEVEPARGLRVLTGANVRFRAPLLDGAAYSWDIAVPGLDPIRTPRHELELRLPAEGQVRARLSVTRPGFAPAEFDRTIEVIDPRLSISLEPAVPCEGETFSAQLAHHPDLGLRRIEWEGGAVSQQGSRALYSFEREGSYSLTASVETDLGAAGVSQTVLIEPGLPLPAVLAPVETVFLSGEPQLFSAEAGRGVAEVRFRLHQAGRWFDLGSAPVQDLEGQWLAVTNWILPAGLAAGNAELVTESVPVNPDLTRRLGARTSTNQVEVSKLALRLRPRSPADRVIYWHDPVTFEAELAGPGAAKVEAVQWDVFAVTPAGTHPIAVLGGIGRDFQEEQDLRVAAFILELDPAGSEFQKWTADNSLLVRASPLGDPQVVAEAQLEWDGLGVRWGPARFVAYGPRRCLLDTPQELTVLDVLSGHPIRSVRWTITHRAVTNRFDTATGSLPHAFTNVGPHEIHAQVTWDGGTAPAEPTPVWVEFEPARAVIEWDGDRRPELSDRGVHDRDVQLDLTGFAGSRASVQVDLRRIVPDGEPEPVLGWPKVMRPEESEMALRLPWPPAPAQDDERYMAKISLVGYDETGALGIVKEDSFLIINGRPVRWWLLVLVGLLMLAVLVLLTHWCWRNAPAEARLYVGTHLGQVKAGETGSLRLRPYWQRWSKRAVIRLKDLAAKTDDLPSWIAEHPLRTLEVRRDRDKITLFFPERGDLYDFEYDQGIGTLTWHGERTGQESRQIFLRPRPGPSRLRWETVAPWILLLIEVPGFLWIYQHWA
jgi:hypothetical protein